jgi:hypothetical protein
MTELQLRNSVMLVMILALMRFTNKNDISDYYYYADINKSGTVSMNELLKTLAHFSDKNLEDFKDDKIDKICK